MSANRYIRFVELSSGLIKDSRIPLFSSKFSKKTYTQHQLLILLLLKEYLAEDYRDTVELTEIMDSLREKIQLDEVPHFTMPQIEDLRQLHQKVQLDPEVLSADQILHLHQVT